MSAKNNALNVFVDTFPDSGISALVVASCHFIKLFVSSVYSAVAGIFAVTAASFHATSSLTSNSSFAPCARPVIVPSLVGSNVTLTYPVGVVSDGPCGTITFGWLVNVIVPPFLMSYSFSTLYSTASSPVPNVNLPLFSLSTVSVGLVPG